MRIASKKTLLTAFPHLTPEQALLIRRLGKARDDGEALRKLIEAKCPATAAYARQCHNDPFDLGIWRTTMALHAIDVILGTHGVEALGKNPSHPFDPPYEYCNAGDPYALTLLYRRDTDTLFVGCWGDIVERRSHELGELGD